MYSQHGRMNWCPVVYTWCMYGKHGRMMQKEMVPFCIPETCYACRSGVSLVWTHLCPSSQMQSWNLTCLCSHLEQTVLLQQCNPTGTSNMTRPWASLQQTTQGVVCSVVSFFCSHASLGRWKGTGTSKADTLCALTGLQELHPYGPHQGQYSEWQNLQ